MVLGGLVKVQSYFKGCLTEQNQSLTFRKWRLVFGNQGWFSEIGVCLENQVLFSKIGICFFKIGNYSKKRRLLLDLGVSFTSPGCALSFELGGRRSP